MNTTTRVPGKNRMGAIFTYNTHHTELCCPGPHCKWIPYWCRYAADYLLRCAALFY